MARPVGRLLLEVLLTVVLALLLLAALHLALGEIPAAALGTAAHHLFLFMDVGLGVWVLLHIVHLVRRRESATSGRSLLFAVVGAIANLLTVTVVGFVQQGALATEFIGFALEAGIAFVLAVLLVLAVRTITTRRTRHARVADTAK